MKWFGEVNRENRVLAAEMRELKDRMSAVVPAFEKQRQIWIRYEALMLELISIWDDEEKSMERKMLEVGQLVELGKKVQSRYDI